MRHVFIIFAIVMVSCTSNSNKSEFETNVAADHELFDSIAVRFRYKNGLTELLSNRFVEKYTINSLAYEYSIDSSVVGNGKSFYSKPELFIKIGGDYSKYKHVDGPSETYHFTGDSLSFSFDVYKAPEDTLAWRYFTEISVSLASDKNKLQEGNIVEYEKCLFFLRKAY